MYKIDINFKKSIFAIVLLCGCTTATNTSETNVITHAEFREFITLFDRNFETAKDNSETIILDRRHRVESPHLQGVWFYTQLNTGADKKLYRQRIVNLVLSEDKTQIIQKTYTLKEPKMYADVWEKSDLLNDLTTEKFNSFFTKGCELAWSLQKNAIWRGHVNPQTCVITSKRRNKDIRIGSVSYLSKDDYRTSESGYDMDMTYLWGSREGELIELYPD